jgi:hypothetical protein
MSEIVRQNIQKFQTKVSQPREQEYKNRLQFLILDMVRKISELQGELQASQQVHIDKIANVNGTAVKLKQFIDDLKNYKVDVDRIKKMLKIQMLATDKSCETAYDHAQNDSINLLKNLSLFISDFKSGKNPSRETDNCTDLLNSLQNYTSCQTGYSEFLTNVSMWRKTVVESGANFSVTTMSNDATSNISYSLTRLQEISVSYGRNSTTKFDLAGNFSALSGDVKNLLTAIRENTVQPILNDIRMHIMMFNDWISSAYINVMNNLVQFDNFHDSTDFADFARDLSIWKRPYPVFYSGQIVQYQLDDSAGLKFWPKSRSLASINALAGQLIQSSVKDYALAANMKLYAFKNDIDVTLKDCERTIDDLVMKLQTFTQSSVMDETFVRNNFLQLQIFYGELQYEDVVQEVAYDAGALLSDIGGYLGLCIGGTAITVFEIIDAVAYSAYIKCCRRKDRESQ